MPNRRTNNFPESGRGLGHVTLQFLAVRSAILATAWLLVQYYLPSHQHVCDIGQKVFHTSQIEFLRHAVQMRLRGLLELIVAKPLTTKMLLQMWKRNRYKSLGARSVE